MNGRATYVASPQLGVYSVVHSYHLNDRQLYWLASEHSNRPPNSDSDSDLESKSEEPRGKGSVMTGHTVPKLREALRDALLIHNASNSHPSGSDNDPESETPYPSPSNRGGSTFTDDGFEYEVELRYGEYGLAWFDKKLAVSYLVNDELVTRQGVKRGEMVG